MNNIPPKPGRIKQSVRSRSAQERGKKELVAEGAMPRMQIEESGLVLDLRVFPAVKSTFLSAGHRSPGCRTMARGPLIIE